MGNKYYTADFQCPETGFGVRFIWDGKTGLLTAEVCNSGCWEHSQNDDIIAETQNWCERFNCCQRTFESIEDANAYVEQYDTMF